MKKLLLTCCALAIGASAGPSMAKDVDEYAVQKIQYKNRGTYNAHFELRFKIRNNEGKTVTCILADSKHDRHEVSSNKNPREDAARATDNSVRAGQTKTYNLDDRSHLNFKKDNPKACDKLKNKNRFGDIPMGSEVRARINIEAGDSENCYKKNKVKFYYHPRGGTVTYLTRGTTLLNNRCRLQSKGGVLWENVQ